MLPAFPAFRMLQSPDVPAFLSPPSCLPSWQIFKQSGQKGAKVKIYLLAFVFSRENRRPKGQNTNIFLKYGAGSGANGAGCEGFGCLLLLVTGAGGRGCFLMPCLRGVFPAFWLLSRFAFDALGLNMPLFRNFRGFLAGFGFGMWVCIACVLCVDCGAFVRVYS